jgi:hypothetical protein
MAAAGVIFVLAAAALAGCMTADAGGSAAMYVKDAPAGISHLYVTFNQVQIHQKGAEHEDDEGADQDDGGSAEPGDDESPDHEDDDGDESSVSSTSTSGTTSPTSSATSAPTSSSATAAGTGRVSVAIEVEEENETDEDGKWITLLDKNTTVDLAAFSGDARAFLGAADVPAGTYNQIRMRVVSAQLVLSNGTTADVKVPSHWLKIKGPFTVETGKETALTLDFDLEKSLHETGNGEWMLKPVLKLESEHREKPEKAEREKREKERDEENERGHHGDDDDSD